MKQKIAFYEMPELMPFNCRLTFDGDKEDLRLHVDEMFRWSGKTKNEYNKAAKEIDNINYKGNGWELYAWYDVSSYEYWVKQMGETNYIQISIRFDNTFVSKLEVDKIANAVDNALADADRIQNKYNYDPSPYNN